MLVGEMALNRIRAEVFRVLLSPNGSTFYALPIRITSQNQWAVKGLHKHEICRWGLHWGRQKGRLNGTALVSSHRQLRRIPGNLKVGALGQVLGDRLRLGLIQIEGESHPRHESGFGARQAMPPAVRQNEFLVSWIAELRNHSRMSG